MPPAWGGGSEGTWSKCPCCYCLNWLACCVVPEQEEKNSRTTVTWAVQLVPLPPGTFPDFDSWFLTSSQAHSIAHQSHIGQWVTGSDKKIIKVCSTEPTLQPVNRVQLFPFLLRRLGLRGVE